MNGRWHTDRRVGQVATLPNGTRVRIASIRGSRVRLEYINPTEAGPTPPQAVAAAGEFHDIAANGSAQTSAQPHAHSNTKGQPSCPLT